MELRLIVNALYYVIITYLRDYMYISHSEGFEKG